MIKEIGNVLILFMLLGVCNRENFILDNVSKESLLPRDLLKIEEILKEDSEALSKSDKDRLKEIKDKIEKYQVLTQEETDFIRDCDLWVLKYKLGEEKYNEYFKLIKKRESKAEFSQEERLRLFELEKEIKGIK